MSTYKATWKYSDALMQHGESNALALQVGGTSWEVVWVTQSYGDLVVKFSPADQYGVYMSSSPVMPNMYMQASVVHQSNLGSTYAWDGHNFTETANTCPADSVAVYNNSNQSVSLGLTKQDPMTGQQRPVCADSVNPHSTHTYTPTTNLYAGLSNGSAPGTVIGNLNSFQHFQISSNCEFNYDAGTNQWVQTDE